MQSVRVAIKHAGNRSCFINLYLLRQLNIVNASWLQTSSERAGKPRRTWKRLNPGALPQACSECCAFGANRFVQVKSWTNVPDFFECGDMSPLLKCGHIRALQHGRHQY